MRSVDLVERYRRAVFRRFVLKLSVLALVIGWIVYPQGSLWAHIGQGAGIAWDWSRQAAVKALGGSSKGAADANAANSIPGLEKLKRVNGFTVPELRCLVMAVYFEAGNDVRDAQIGVAQVALNRVAASKTPREICRVVYAGLNQQSGNGCLFDATCRSIGAVPRLDGSFGRSVDVAMEAASGTARLPQLAKATHFHEGRSRPGWALSLYKIGRIGRFDFYSTEFPDDPAALSAAASGSAAADKVAADRATRSVVKRQTQKSQTGALPEGNGDLSRRVFGIE